MTDKEAQEVLDEFPDWGTHRGVLDLIKFVHDRAWDRAYLKGFTRGKERAEEYYNKHSNL